MVQDVSGGCGSTRITGTKVSWTKGPPRSAIIRFDIAMSMKAWRPWW